MLFPNASVSPSYKDSNSASNGASTDDLRLQELKELWQTNRREALEVRHKSGLILNDQFGPPTMRQAHGPAVLKHYSACLGIAESELSRMRWFAHHFKSLADLNANHPEVSMWTQVKELLVSLRHRNDAGRHAKKAVVRKETARRPRSVSKAMKAIQATKRLVAGIELKPASADWKAVNGAVAEMLKAVGQSLGVHYVSESIAIAEEKLFLPTLPNRVIEPEVPAQDQLIYA
jgi:hypothetical protein